VKLILLEIKIQRDYIISEKCIYLASISSKDEIALYRIASG